MYLERNPVYNWNCVVVFYQMSDVELVNQFRALYMHVHGSANCIS